MGIYFDAALRVGVRLLRLIDGAWFAVKEHVGADFQHFYDTEFAHLVGNPEFRVEWAHPGSSVHDVDGASDCLIWSPSTVF
jgi:hypothetical protein